MFVHMLVVNKSLYSYCLIFVGVFFSVALMHNHHIDTVRSRKIWYLWCPIRPAETCDTCRYVSSVNFWNSRPAHKWYSDTLLDVQHVCRRCVVSAMPSNTAPYHTVDTWTISWASSLEQEIHQIQYRLNASFRSLRIHYFLFGYDLVFCAFNFFAVLHFLPM